MVRVFDELERAAVLDSCGRGRILKRAEERGEHLRSNRGKAVESEVEERRDDGQVQAVYESKPSTHSQCGTQRPRPAYVIHHDACYPAAIPAVSGVVNVEGKANVADEYEELDRMEDMIYKSPVESVP